MKTFVLITLLLIWFYNVSEETVDMVFNVRATTDLSLPMADWPVIASVDRTNRAWFIAPGMEQQFFTLTASNQFGESDFGTKLNFSFLAADKDCKVPVKPTIPARVNKNANKKVK